MKIRPLKGRGLGHVIKFCVLTHHVVSTSASDWLEGLVSETTYNVLMGTLNPTHSLPTIIVSVQEAMLADVCFKRSDLPHSTAC